MDEILVKGADGKWYIARDGKLILQDDAAQEKPVVAPPVVAPLIKPVVPVAVSAPAVASVKVTPPDVIKTPEILPPAPVAKLREAPKVSLLPPTVVKKPVTDAPRIDASVDVEKIIAATVLESKLNFPDPSLTKRFKLLIASRLREVRRAEDVHALLTRETGVGGLGLPEADAERVAAIIEKSFVEFHKKWEQVEADRKAAVLKNRAEAAKNTQAVMVGEPMIDEVVTVKQKAGSLKNLPSEQVDSERSIEKKSDTLPSLPKEVVAGEKTIEPFTKASPASGTQKPFAKPQPLPSKKPAMPDWTNMGQSPARVAVAVTDIRKPKLLTPADELREMKLIDFRRMGKAGEATARIKSKIDMLGAESLTKKREAVAAWKQSEIYTVYADMMGVAMAQGKSIDREISERAKSGKPHLTIDEIDAIMSLNELLRQ